MRQLAGSIYYAIADQIYRARLAGKSGLDAEHKALAWGYRRKPAPHVMTTRNGVKMHFAEVDYIPLILDYLGCFEPHCLEVADALISQVQASEPLILDIGGNIGAHALQFAQALGPVGTVVTIEAMPNHAATIARNLALNKGRAMADLHVKNVAVGAENGRLKLSLPIGGNGGCYTAGLAAEGAEVVEIPMTKIDTIMSTYEGANVALMKMDVEGSELNALKGAAETIERHKPHILIEINEVALNSCGTSSSALKDFFNSQGYEGFLIDRTKEGKAVIKNIPTDHEHVTDETLFVHTSKLPFTIDVLRKAMVCEV